MENINAQKKKSHSKHYALLTQDKENQSHQ